MCELTVAMHLGRQVLCDVGGETAQFLLHTGQDGVNGVLDLAGLAMPFAVDGRRVLLNLVGDRYDEGERLRDQQQFQNLETAHQGRSDMRERERERERESERKREREKEIRIRNRLNKENQRYELGIEITRLVEARTIS